MAVSAEGRKTDNRKKVITRYKKRRFQWIYLIFAGIVIYLFVQVAHFADNDNIALFEVKTSETMNTNRQYTGMITREEYVYTADHAGYINFYITNGQKSASGATVYTIDETGNYSQLLIAASNDGADLARESLLEIKSELTEFSASFDAMSFRDVYSMKDRIAVTVMDALNDEAIRQLNETSADASFYRVSAEQSGFVVYASDQYDGLTAAELTSNDIKRQVADTLVHKSGELVSEGDFAYKLIKDDCFSIHFLLTEDDMNQFGKDLSYTEPTRQQVYLTEMDQTITGDLYLELLADDVVGARIDFISRGSNFLDSRFVEFEMVKNEITGLKIPATAVTEKSFFLIPAEYLPSESKSNVFFYKEALNAMGEVTVETVQARIYGTVTETVEAEDGEGTRPQDVWYYVGCEELALGDVLRKADSDGSYVVSKQVSLPGVYIANQGYTEFRQIEILGTTADGEYKMIASNTRYGISPFDYIVIDATGMEEYRVLYY